MIVKATIWMSVLPGRVFALLRFHCIMHSPQYLSSANTSARWSGGRLRLHGAALGPAEGLLESESFRNLTLPSSASRWRHSCGKGRSVRFGRKSPFFPSFLQMPMFIFGLICLTYAPWPGIWAFLICALWQWVINGEFGRCEFNMGFRRSCPKYVITDRNNTILHGLLVHNKKAPGLIQALGGADKFSPTVNWNQLVNEKRAWCEDPVMDWGPA